MPEKGATMTILAERIDWQTLEEAKERSARQGQAILLDFSAAPG
jgi:hypothetical protein